MIEAAISVFLGVITVFIGYTTLFQKAEDVGHARPIFSAVIVSSDHGGESLVLTNEGGRVAVAVTITVRPSLGGAEHRDVVRLKGEIVIPLTSAAPDEVDVTMEFDDVGRHSTRASRVFRRAADDTLKLIDGDDRTKGIVRTRRIAMGSSAVQARRIN